jgi:hypothetical protein
MIAGMVVFEAVERIGAWRAARLRPHTATELP